jgi:malate dehydrogenase
MSTKVTVLGASGGIGQPLSMLLKLSPYITELACYDIANTPGVAADLSHVSDVCRMLLVVRRRRKIKTTHTNERNISP